MGLRTVAVGCAVAVLTLGVAGCGDEEPSGPPDLGGSPTAEASASPSGSASPVDEPAEKGDKVADDYDVSAGTLPDDRRQSQVAKALVDYLDARVASFNSGSVVPYLPGVATGEALTAVQGRVSELVEQGLHTVGEMVVNVDDVEIQGDTATVSGCVANSTVDVNQQGVAVESPPAAYDVTAGAVRAGDSWLISSLDATAADGC